MKDGGHPTDEYVRVAEFRSALRRFLGGSERVARSYGLTPQRYLLLLMIKGAPNGSEHSTVTELSDRLQLAQSTVTELVARAEEAGLVSREPSTEDARVAFLRVTPEGEARLAQAFASLAEERANLRRALLELPPGG
jgi:DNA-binding MarR family transcriptional regulator